MKFFSTCRRLFAAVATLSLCPAAVVAQVPAAPAPVAPVVIRNLTMEWGFVVIMVGLVLFVICRSSRRN